MFIRFKFWLLPALAIAVVLTGCELLGSSGGEPIPPESRIEFKSTGGFAGITWHDLTISEDGLVTDRAVTPNLTRQLSPDEHQLLLDVFDGFVDLPEQVGEYLCADDVLNQVTVHHDGVDHTSAAWGCALNGDKLNPDLARMRRIVTALGQLSRDIYETQAPWRGLEATFSTDRQAYKPGDPITITAHVRNPTSGKRSVFFRQGDERIGFQVFERDGPNFYFAYPPREDEQVSVPLDEVVIGPGEEKVFTLVWDGKVPGTEGTAGTLAPGEYALRPYLRDTSQRFYPDIIVVTVVNG